MKLKNLFVAALSLLALCSCQKEGLDAFRGNYSFKLSGYFYAEKEKADDSANPDSLTVKITTDSGQMDITSIDEAENRAVITMNITGGDLLVLYATISGNSLTIDPKRRVTKINTASISYDEDAGELQLESDNIEIDITISGTGTLYDNIIIFDLKYDGCYSIKDTSYRIYESHIDCRAKRNE